MHSSLVMPESDLAVSPVGMLDAELPVGLPLDPSLIFDPFGGELLEPDVWVFPGGRLVARFPVRFPPDSAPIFDLFGGESAGFFGGLIPVGELSIAGKIGGLLSTDLPELSPSD